MKRKINTLFTITLLTLLSVVIANCSKPISQVNQEATIEASIHATLTAENAIHATVEAGIRDTQTAMEAVTEEPATTQVTQTTMVIPDSPSAPPIELSGPVTISRPADGADVHRFTEVSGFVDKSALQGKVLNVIVTTRTREHWVQKVPIIKEDGAWSSDPVILGSVSIGIGEQFTICAVIANQQLPEGQIFTYPDGSKVCIEVTRVE